NNTIKLKTTGSNGGNIDQLNVIPYLDDCDELVNWTTASANTLTYHTADKKQGVGSLQMVGSATDEFKRSFATSLNSGVSIANGVLSFWYYVSDVTKCGTVRVELGSGGAADVNELSWALSGLVNGWNYINLNTSDAVKAGSPNMNALNWFRIYNSKTGSITTRLDAIRILDSASMSGSQLLSGNIASRVELQSRSMEQSVVVYPNPYKEGILSIDLSGFENLKKVNVKIVNIAGQTIYQNSFQNSSHLQLKLSHQLKESVYLIHVEAGNTQIVKRLVVN
ncbi:MAG TPA: T9SS type A sorting domain-containing protein, partial [Arachidicoccus soli]|nr:T9SS type A sorting domain-containing protein [Arachidicoccus soli]